MKVVRAEIMGMCCGVRRAVDIAREVPSPGAVTILGELVHNEQVQEGLLALAQAGITQVRLAALPSGGADSRHAIEQESAEK